MKNLEIYNQIKNVPEEAKKIITGGRLSGLTDIKPMWRIEKLTELFGVCGFGWKTVIKNKEVIEGANGEKIAIVDIDLFVKIDNEWSEAIEGTGGSSFISKESKGLYTSDECFKMAYTDALSVACKSLGMGADVYWGDSKYDTNEITEENAEEFAKTYMFKSGKHSNMTLKQIIDEKDTKFLDWLLENSKDEKIKKTIEFLTGRKVPSQDEQIERLKLISNINDLCIDKNVDLEKVKEKFKVNDLKEMTIEQLRKCVDALEKKQNE